MQNLVTNFKQLDTLSQQQLLKILLSSQKASAMSQLAAVNHDINYQQDRGEQQQKTTLQQYSMASSSPEK